MGLFALGASLLGSPLPALDTAPAEGPLQIAHTPLVCAIADRYPRLQATITPADRVGAARVRFRTRESAGWYTTSLTPTDGVFQAVLPRPRWAKQFDYSIEAADLDGRASRTPETTVKVVRAQDCPDAPAAETAANLIVEKPTGAPKKAGSVPPGFSGRGTAGDAGVFEIRPRTAVIAMGAILAGAVAGITTQVKDPFVPPTTPPPPYTIGTVRFGSSRPPVDSQVSVGSDRLSLSVFVEVRDVVTPPTLTVLVQFLDGASTSCVTMAGPFPGVTGESQVAGPLDVRCPLPFRTTRVVLTVLNTADQSVAPGNAQVSVPAAYEFVP